MGSPRWVSILASSSGAVMKAMIFIGPPQRMQVKGRASYTLAINMAQTGVAFLVFGFFCGFASSG